MNKLSLGLDPGFSGAIAFIPDKGKPWTIKNTETLTDLCEALRDAIRAYPECFAVIEVVNAMPGQGVSSCFKFGRSYGNLEALLVASGIPFERVRPLKWQTALQCRTKGDKRVSRAKAQELFPELKITHAIADSLLLARYAQMIRP